MEEKERYELFEKHCIKDNNPDARPQLLDAYVACVILNEQDKENQQLKQSQKQLAIKELEKLKDFFLEPYRDEEMDTDFLITKDAGSIADYVLDRIKELKGEE